MVLHDCCVGIKCNLNYRKGVKPVASNFRIFLHETRDSLHLKLDGDFDGSSAHELFNTLKKHGVGFHQVFIDTNDLKTIYPFGRDVFQKKLSSFNKKIKNLIFIGENGDKISPN